MTTLAVIGGSEAYRVLERDFPGRDTPASDTPFGKAQPIRTVENKKGCFLFLSRHGRNGYEISAPFVNYRANIFALKEMGATHILAWTGPGAINTDFKVGSYAIATDIIDETRNRKNTFFENRGLGFVRQNPVFCPALSKAISKSLEELELEFSPKATCVITEGPRLETPAEINKYRVLGADLVSMTLAPEVFLAKELEMHYAALCYISNMAEGVRSAEFESGKLFEGLASENDLEKAHSAVDNFVKIISRVQSLIETRLPECACEKLLERYRKEGRIGNSYKEYIN